MGWLSWQLAKRNEAVTGSGYLTCSPPSEKAEWRALVTREWYKVRGR
jgi:hypothetical protein